MASRKRFVLLGGPGGHLTCRPVGCPLIAGRYRQWQELARINRPLTTRLDQWAKGWALRTCTYD